MPPGAISPSIMLKIVMPPPPGENESWKELTAPVEVSVVDAANSADAQIAEPLLLALHHAAGRVARPRC